MSGASNEGSSRARSWWVVCLLASCSPTDAGRDEATDIAPRDATASETIDFEDAHRETGEAEIPNTDAVEDDAEARDEIAADIRGEIDLRDAGDSDSIPPLLSGTGLYADLALGEGLAAGVEPYAPSYELWADGAAKRRWLWLPAGSKIDTSNMDVWRYPIGTRVWKEFRREGVRVETRFITKVGDDRWAFMAFEWKHDQSDAVAVPKGLADANGTTHDIPSQVDCGICHNNMPDRLLGVTAVQLAHGGDGITLQKLSDEGKLTQPPARAPTVPGNDVARAALGYLHANCGNCHNPDSSVYPTTKLVLWLSTSLLGSVDETPTYRTTVGVPFEGVRPAPEVPPMRITPGSPEESALYHRMSSRAPNVQMPPIATELPDASGRANVASWIAGLAD